MAVLTVVFLAGLAGLNFQALSGYDAQHVHFLERLILPMGCLVGGCWLLPAVEIRGFRGPWNAVAGCILACILLNAGARQRLPATRSQPGSAPVVRRLSYWPGAGRLGQPG